MKNRPPKWTVAANAGGRRSLYDDDDDAVVERAGRGSDREAHQPDSLPVEALNVNAHAAQPAITLVAMSESQSQLSAQAYERLRQELEERTTTRRVQVSLWIERAREHGDLKENADYDEAKREQGMNEARIRQLEGILKAAVVVDGATGDVVEAGCLVDILYDGDDAPVTYLVGSIEERNESYDVLSLDSPLGQAIKGAGPGTSTTYQGPKRELQVTVVDVRPLT
jgi:transcription elongation factor GreA